MESKTFDTSTVKGLKAAETYKATLENKYDKVVTTPAGLNRVKIEGTDSKQTLYCGHEPSEHSEHTTGTARISDAKEICWRCAALAEVGHMVKTGKAVLYWSKNKEKGWLVTNWPGSLKFDHVRATTGRHNIGRTRDDVWFVGPDGFIWHGVQIGQWNEILRAKRTKQRTSLPFNAVQGF